MENEEKEKKDEKKDEQETILIDEIKLPEDEVQNTIYGEEPKDELAGSEITEEPKDELVGGEITEEEKKSFGGKLPDFSRKVLVDTESPLKKIFLAIGLSVKEVWLSNFALLLIQIIIAAGLASSDIMRLSFGYFVLHAIVLVFTIRCLWRIYTKAEDRIGDRYTKGIRR